jgi:hypothetical protein
LISKVRRRKVDPAAAARWEDATRDRDTLRDAYAPLADEDRALAEAHAEDLAQSLAEADRGAPPQ